MIYVWLYADKEKNKQDKLKYRFFVSLAAIFKRGELYKVTDKLGLL